MTSKVFGFKTQVTEQILELGFNSAELEQIAVNTALKAFNKSAWSKSREWELESWQVETYRDLHRFAINVVVYIKMMETRPADPEPLPEPQPGYMRVKFDPPAINPPKMRLANERPIWLSEEVFEPVRPNSQAEVLGRRSSPGTTG